MTPRSFDWITNDFRSLLPSEAQSRRPELGRWQMVDYQTDAFSGSLLMANPATAAPTVTIPLPLKGSFDLVLGLQENLCDRFKVKLSTDRAFSRVTHTYQRMAEAPAFQEVFWRRVELDGTQSLVIHQEPGFRVSLGFVGARAAGGAPSPEHAKTFLVHVTDDGHPGNWGMPEDDEDAVWQAEFHAGLGADLVSYGVSMSGMATYPSRHESLRVDPTPALAFSHPWESSATALRLIEENLRLGRNVPERFFALAKALGMRSAAYVRMAHIADPPPFDALQAKLPARRPECFCVDFDGRQVNRMSIAFPEVRAEFLKLFTESVELGADAINDVFVRGVPMVLYEEPVRTAFKERHGIDALSLPENDPRVLHERARWVTLYMSEQREAVRQAAGGREVSIIATVPATKEVCDFFGLDVAGWVRQGLIDLLCPYPWSWEASAAPLEMDRFTEVVRGSQVKLLPFINTWRDKDPAVFLDKAMALCRWPIDGLSVWDAYRGPDFDRAIRGLGSLAGMRAARDEIVAGPAHHLIRTLDSFAHDKYNFGWTY